MPNPEQIMYFWLKWIDRQFAKVDPSHVKMRPEVSEFRERSATAEDVVAREFAQDQANKLPPLGNRSKRAPQQIKQSSAPSLRATAKPSRLSRSWRPLDCFALPAMTDRALIILEGTHG